ncbi:MAG: S8 family serine peptidase, partial [Ginsengibacter sp.]
MKLSGFVPYLLGILLFDIGHVTAQVNTEFRILKEASVKKAAEEEVTFKKLLQLSKDKGWKMMVTGKNGRVIRLSGIDQLGYPLYVSTENNAIAAASIKTNLLWPGGSTGLALDGSSANIKGKIGIWDGGKVRNTHVELVGRVIQKDNVTALNDHATHVAGTMIAGGVNPIAKGMSFKAQQLVAYDFDNHLSEMLAEAPNLLISNHSYGNIAGWHYSDTDKRWDFYGAVGANEDYKFGFYSAEAQVWDSISYNAPNYLIVKSAGNDRNENGPEVGQPYWRMDASGTFISAGNRPASISNNNGYDNIPTYGTSKNILTVGAINPIPGGYSISSDAQLSTFSSWGPTDDGRIKPDVVTDGVNVVSSISTGDNNYANFSGTSMASPAAAGSVFLLQEYYSRLHPNIFMRSATLKGIIIHTADDGGNVGPDYQFGWGVVNMEKAAAIITTDNTSKSIYENNLVNGGNFSLPVVASGKGPLVVTICWTDPKATVESANLLNNATKKLVNDLDIRVKRGTTTIYMPWILTPANPSAPATTGDNTLDNVEKIEIPDAIPGETYTIQVTHKGTLSRGQQAYSLIVSGAGGQPYCASAATSNAGARIDKVTVGSFSLTSPAGCTTYTNNTGSTISIEAGATIPVAVTVSSCDATTANKIVKVFIDYNNDGDFIDAGETVAQSTTISGNGIFSGNIITPGTLPAGNYAIMRIIVQQTATASDVNPCGNYANGETQDYRLKINNSSNDVGVMEIVSPSGNSCSNGSQLVSVRIKNFGSGNQVNIPLTLSITNGAATIATLTALCADTIHAYSDVVYTFQTPFNALAANTYSITGTANLAGDQNSQNNSVTSTVSVGAAATSPIGSAALCGTTQVFLTATTGASDIPLWYSSASSTTPIAAGKNVSSTVITADKTYYLAINNLTAKAGPANKNTLGSGSYGNFNNNYVKFTNSVPLTIETVRLFVGAAGKLTFIVADLISSNASTYTYTTIASTTIDVYATGTSTADQG